MQMRIAAEGEAGDRECICCGAGGVGGSTKRAGRLNPPATRALGGRGGGRSGLRRRAICAAEERMKMLKFKTHNRERIVQEEERKEGEGQGEER